MSDQNIKPQTTGGIWFPNAFRPEVADAKKPIILHFHPGGYVMGDVRVDGAFAARLLSEKIGCYALWTDHGEAVGLPAPRGALIFSPAVSFLAATDPKTVLENPNYKNDYMDPTFVTWGARRFVLNEPTATTYMNPLQSPFKSPCPIWVYCGGCELFYDDATEFVSKMKDIPGNEVSYVVKRLANHDISFAGNLLGWKTEAEKIADRAGRWVAELLH
ncbi:hypothetical protein JX265_004602 [Neoarthrinium moseri]|uniref:Alpha/beta hydrolase fold-3 domain-containing protein n=1 Tax=Neoarthrinium moseri TaxID=1658444 RepID=A0A9P9WPZ9_9PEZI|nr:hypothetical protein JX265_004602 [Neoarthrinium moseri]